MRKSDRFSRKEVIFTALAFVLISLIARFAQADGLQTVAQQINKSATLTEAVLGTLAQRSESIKSDIEKYLVDRRAEKPGKVRIRENGIQIWARNSFYLLDLRSLAKGKILFNGHTITYDRADSPAVLLYKLESALPSELTRGIDSVMALSRLEETPSQAPVTTPSDAGVVVTAAMTVIALSH